jgi:3',5'-cyclic AMP phosphodiesterase CpdA
MVRAVVDGGAARLDGAGFTVSPPGVDGDFSFIVIGDTGEGDASQHVLRDSLWRAAGQDAVRFVVISSDVVYPTGAMRDYEARFSLPFKGVTTPIYAIPGNHDWYDALEAFVATFFDPKAARLALRARIEADNRITSTTDDTIDDWLARARTYRREYGLETGFQQAPFFQVQTDTFALIAVDTGVLRRVDPEQMAWLRAALEAARGKTIMAVLGHPFYAGGADVVAGDESFGQLRDLLRQHEVRIVMAGDTHDLEYYLDDHATAVEPTRHFVNGGGGAYLSFGTALAWPAVPAIARWAYYPATAAVRQKIQAETPWWKRPAWWWTDGFGAWPFSAEWLSAAFDSNVSPFFQSFVEVRVEPSANRVRVLPWGVHGRLTWGDLQVGPGVLPPGASADTPVEWVVPMGR